MLEKLCAKKHVSRLRMNYFNNNGDIQLLCVGLCPYTIVIIRDLLLLLLLLLSM